MYLIVVVILLDSATMYRYVTTSPLYGRGFGLELGCLCVLFVLLSGRLSIRTGTLVRLLAVVAVFLVYALVTRYNTSRFLTSFVGAFVFLFLFAYFLYRRGEMQKFLRVFSNVMLVMCFVSLFFWLFGSLLDLLPGRTELTYYWANRYRTTFTYAYLYFENPVQNSVHGTICNLGIFTEAPGYSSFLTYALLIEMVFRKLAVTKEKRRDCFRRIVVFMVTLLSTSSTKGIMVVMLAIAIEYIAKGSRTRLLSVVKVVATVLVIAVIAYVGNNMISQKLTTTSGIVRWDDFVAGIEAFLEHPLFGSGYQNSQAVIDYQDVTRTNRGLSMGLTVLLAYGGLWLTAVYLGAVRAAYDIRLFSEKKSIWFLVVAVLFFNLLISNAAFSIPYIFLLAAAYAAPTWKEVRAGQAEGA